jgi:hypothetical protein
MINNNMNFLFICKVCRSTFEEDLDIAIQNQVVTKVSEERNDIEYRCENCLENN